MIVFFQTLFAQILSVAFPLIFSNVIHMLFVRFQWLSFLAHPLDAHKTFRGKRIFGDSKTLRGLIIVTLLTAVFSEIQKYILLNNETLQPYSILSFQEIHAFMYGLGFGFFYMIFELPNSFIKRQLDIQPGMRSQQRSWVFFSLLDQADSIIGAVLYLCIFYNVSWQFGIITILAGTGIHLFFNVLLFILGIRKHPL